MQDHKGFDPSAKKLREARKLGKSAKSPSLTQAAAFLVILACIFNGLAYQWLNSQQMIEWCLSVPFERLGACTMRIGSQTLWMLLGSLACGAVAVLLTEVLQVKVSFCWDPLSPKLDRLNPANGFKRIMKGFSNTWLLILKLILVLMLAWHFILGFVDSAQDGFLILGKEQIFILLKKVVRLAYLSSALLLCFGVAEYLLMRRRFMRENSMSLDEVRREYKEEEGDPSVKAHRRALHEAVVMQEMVKRVRSSKVIIVE